MKKRYLYALKNAELEGKLPEFLDDARKTGLSYSTIAKKLSSTGVTVGRTAVWEWVTTTPTEVTN